MQEVPDEHRELARDGDRGDRRAASVGDPGVERGERSGRAHRTMGRLDQEAPGMGLVPPG
ncbi:MAG TPA: hypothetical protein VHG53_04225 [Candidatus Limnocylindria bacterium]|nr:hypothetical protein [Candidatus Limnocylindria bacterium]